MPHNSPVNANARDVPALARRRFAAAITGNVEPHYKSPK